MVAGTPWVASCTVTVDQDRVETCSGPGGRRVAHLRRLRRRRHARVLHPRPLPQARRRRDRRPPAGRALRPLGRRRRPRCSRRPPRGSSRSPRWRRSRGRRRTPPTRRISGSGSGRACPSSPARNSGAVAARRPSNACGLLRADFAGEQGQALPNTRADMRQGQTLAECPIPSRIGTFSDARGNLPAPPQAPPVEYAVEHLCRGQMRIRRRGEAAG